MYGWAKLFDTTPEYVLYDMSYENLVLYGAAAPRYGDGDSADGWDDSLDANNPDNFNNLTEEEFI